jgi:hypothetical protein
LSKLESSRWSEEIKLVVVSETEDVVVVDEVLLSVDE